jgi:hypothetical protein
MELTPEEKALHDSVFDAIARGKIKMRSKWYFVLRTTLKVVGSFIIGLFIVYIAGFIIFILRQSGALLAPEIGFTGWYIFFRSLPWLLILLSLVFILVLIIFVHHYSFVYQRPLLYSLIGILIIVTATSYFIAFTPFNSSITNMLDYGNAPVFGGYYGGYGEGEITDVHRGQIILIASNGFILEGLRGETSTVIFEPGTATSSIDSLKPGDLVVVFGDRDSNGFIEASAVEKF